MSSYLTSPKDSFVPTSLYTPNFDAISGLLRIKQSQYDQGFNQVKSVQNSLLNAQVTKAANNESKDLYIRNAQQQLQNLSNADLSDPTNVAKANSVFQPFFEDKDLQSDVLWTKQNQNEIQKGLNLRDSTDPKDRDQYFAQSIGVLQDAQDKVRNGAKGDMSVYENKRYVPYKDPVAYLADQAKKEGLDIVYTEGADKPQLVKYENGNRTVQDYKSWAQARLSTPEFQSIAGVMGEYDINNQIKSYTKRINPITGRQFTEDEVKPLIANDYVNSMVDHYHNTAKMYSDNMNDIAQKMKIINDKYQSGQSWSDQDTAILADLKNQYDGNKYAKEKNDNEANNWIKPDPNNPNANSKYAHTIDNIINFGNTFFAQQWNERMANNWAVTYANTHSKMTVSNNEAYNDKIKNELEAQKVRYEGIKLQAQISGGMFNKTGRGGVNGSGIGLSGIGTGTDYNNDGTPDQNEGYGGSNGKISASEHEKLYNQSPDSAQDQGLAGTENLDRKIEHPDQVFRDTLHNQFSQAINMRYDAYSKILPHLGLVLKDANGKDIPVDETFATAFANESKDNYIDFKQHGDNSAINQLGSYLKSQGYNIVNGSPTSVHQALTQLVSKKVQDFANGNAPLPDGIKDGLSELNNSDGAFDKWNKSYNDYKNRVNDLLVSDKTNKYNSIRVLDDGKYRPINVNDIKNDLKPLEGSIHETSGHPINSLHNYSTNTLSTSELAQAYLDGKVQLKLEGPQFRGSKEGPIEVPQLTIDGKDYSVNINQINYLRSLKNKYGDSSSIPQKFTAINNLAAESLNNNMTGILGHILNYPVNAEQGKETYGTLLANELSNPVNRQSTNLPPSDDVDKFINQLGGNLSNIKSVKILPTSSKGTPAAQIVFNNDYIEKEIKNGNSIIKNLPSDGLTIYLPPTAQGTAINRIIQPKENFVYDEVLHGKPLNSTPLQEAANFKYTIIPSNHTTDGYSNKKADYCTVVIQTKQFDPKTGTWSTDFKPYEQIGSTARYYTNSSGQTVWGGGDGKLTIPLTGDKGKSIDDVKAYIDGLFTNHLSTSNELIKTHLNSNISTKQSPQVDKLKNDIQTILNTNK